MDPSQKKFTLQEASLKVKVEDGQIQEINVSTYQIDACALFAALCTELVRLISWHDLQMVPTKGAGFTGLYEALGGRVPSAF